MTQDRTEKVSLIDMAIALGLLIFTAYILVSCGDTVSTAAHEETVNQRHIADGSWKHLPGVYEYQQFTENNK